MAKQEANIKFYDSVEKFISVCDGNPNATWDKHTRYSREATKDWNGNVSYEGAKELATNGWEAGLKQVSEGIAKLEKNTFGKTWEKNISGAFPDVARCIAGVPDCMNRRVFNDSARKPCLDIVISTAFSCGISGKSIMNYGIAICSLIDELENNGYSVSLKLSNFNYSYSYSDYQFGFVIDLKRHGEAADIGRFIYFIAHPSMHRRISFSHMETTEDYKFISSSYGVPDDLPKKYQGDLYFPKMHSLKGCETISGAMDYVKELVRAQMPDLIDREAA